VSELWKKEKKIYQADSNPLSKPLKKAAKPLEYIARNADQFDSRSAILTLK
jgi:hypothetical protein